MGSLAHAPALLGLALVATSGCVRSDPVFPVVPMALVGLASGSVALRADGQVLVDGRPACGRFDGDRVVEPDGTERWHVVGDGTWVAPDGASLGEGIRFEGGDVLVRGERIHVDDDGAVRAADELGTLHDTGLRIAGFTPRARRTALAVTICALELKATAAVWRAVLGSLFEHPRRAPAASYSQPP